MRPTTTTLSLVVGLTLLGVSGTSAQQLSQRFQDARPPAPEVIGVATAAPASDLQERDGFATTGFAQFIASPAGRILRGVVGAGMIAGGIAMDDTGGTVLAVAGAVPLSAGVFDLCYVSALLGGPVRGEAIREAGRDGG